MCLQRPEPLGDRGRAHHVDDEEEASLGVGPAILSKQKSHERAVADEARGLKHHHHDGNRHEREANRNQPGARVIDSDDAQQALSRLAGEDRTCDRAVDKRLQDEHRSERQRVEPSHRSARQQEDLDAGGEIMADCSGSCKNRSPDTSDPASSMRVTGVAICPAGNEAQRSDRIGGQPKPWLRRDCDARCMGTTGWSDHDLDALIQRYERLHQAFK